MSESENSEAVIHEPAAFGQQLMLAREKLGMSVEEAARAMNLKQEIVEAIEDSALDKLPPVTFVQGYLRSYARLLGISEEKLLSEFEEEVPHELESELHPRPPSPEGANSQSPIIKLVSVLVIVLALVVLMYAFYSYLSERTKRIEQASQAGDDDAMVQLPPEAPVIAEQAETAEQLAPLTDTPSVTEDQEMPAEPVPEPTTETAVDSAPPAEFEAEVEVAEKVVEETVPEGSSEVSIDEIMPIPTPQPITGGDTLVLRAEQESWAEIVDANDIRLFYGTILPGRELKLVGQAPFDVFLGNAPGVSLSLNSVDVKMTKYIRSNNIAQFKISVEDGRVRFY